MNPQVLIFVLFLSSVCYWAGYRFGIRDSHKQVEEKAERLLQICLTLLDALAPEEAKKIRQKELV